MDISYSGLEKAKEWVNEAKNKERHNMDKHYEHWKVGNEKRSTLKVLREIEYNSRRGKNLTAYYKKDLSWEFWKLLVEDIVPELKKVKSLEVEKSFCEILGTRVIYVRVR